MKQVGVFEWAVAACGAVLIGLLWAPWYTAISAGWTTYTPGGGGPFDLVKLTGWDAGTATSIAVLVVGALCIAQFIALWSSRSPAVGVAWNTGICWATVILVVWMLIRVIWSPDDTLREWGVWCALIAALGALNFAWLGMRDERTSRPRDIEVPVRPIPPVA